MEPAEATLSKHIDIVFDGPLGPECGRFVEVEIGNDIVHYRSMRFGEWIDRGDGYWVLSVALPEPSL